MAKYIDSEKLKELIDEKWKELANKDLKVGGNKWNAEIDTYLSVLTLIDSLQQDQSNNNLEEKAKAYDEALEQARFYHGNCPSEPEKKKLEKMFPVLCESEDEKIRNEILIYIGARQDIDLETHNRWCAYLEKQKEQKSAEYLDKDKIYAIMTKLTNLSYSTLISVNSDEYKKIDEITSDVRKLLDYPIEQKPAEWSKEDERNISAIKIALRDAKLEALEEFESNGVEMTVKDFESAELWLKSLHSSWKPSEKEKMALRIAICVLAEENYPKTVANLQAILDAFDDKESRKD